MRSWSRSSGRMMSTSTAKRALPTTALPTVSSSGIVDAGAVESQQKQRTAAWALSPNKGIVFDDTWTIVGDLKILIKRLRAKQAKDGKSRGGGVGDSSSTTFTTNNNNNTNNFDSYSDAGWSQQIGPSSEMSERRVFWEESGHYYSVFLKELRVLRNRADGARSREEAFDGHMAIGRALFDDQLFEEALVSFKRACELQPVDVRPHFRAGTCLYALCRCREAKGEFVLALEAAEAGRNQWYYLLPQIYVNLGIALEGEGMVLSACEYYREAAIVCPTHFRALKLLGGALFGVGEYWAAVKALEEAIFMKPDYADAHCDLASALMEMGEDERAIEVFQKAIDLKPGHVHALYNLGRLYMNLGRFQMASEMYARVLAVWPNHWRAQLNKAFSLLGAWETDEAKKAFKEALKMTNRAEVDDVIAHLKHLQKKKVKENEDVEGAFVIIESSKFKTVDETTTLRQDLTSALQIRAFQRVTWLNRCDVELVKKEMSGNNVPISYSATGAPEKSIRKPNLEQILHKLLNFVKPETFQEAVKAINERILSVLDLTGSGRVDLGMFYAVLAPICSGPPEKRKRVAYDALLWRSMYDGVDPSQIRKADALDYIKLSRAIYIPTSGSSEIHEVHGNMDISMISFSEFLVLFDDRDWGFGILSTLMKLETGDRTRHGHHICSVCQYPIVGSRFKETKTHFSLCNQCYCEGKVPPTFKQEVYRFREYASESEATKDKCTCFTVQSNSSS